MDTQRTIKYPGYNIQKENRFNLHSALLNKSHVKMKKVAYKPILKALGVIVAGAVIGAALKLTVRYYANH